MGIVTLVARPSDTGLGKIKEWHIQISGLTEHNVQELKQASTSSLLPIVNAEGILPQKKICSLTWSTKGEGLHGTHPPMKYVTAFLCVLDEMGFELKGKVIETSASPFQGYVWTLIGKKSN